MIRSVLRIKKNSSKSPTKKFMKLKATFSVLQSSQSPQIIPKADLIKT